MREKIKEAQFEWMMHKGNIDYLKDMSSSEANCQEDDFAARFKNYIKDVGLSFLNIPANQSLKRI